MVRPFPSDGEKEDGAEPFWEDAQTFASKISLKPENNRFTTPYRN
jgi:hypothetical protein